MRTRRLGESELELPVVTFGAWAIGGWNWGGTDDGRAARAIHRALEVGMTAIDTAPVYGCGHSERVVAAALASSGRRRDEVQILTKAGLRWDDERGPVAFEGAGPDGAPLKIRTNSRPDSLRWEVEHSLARLDVETIDLLQIHRPDPTTPIAEAMGALLDLRHEGKLRAIGVSNYTPEQMEEARAALGDVPLASDQPRYSLMRREIEADVLPYTRAHGIGVVVYSPIEQGLLTGRVSAERTFPDGDGRRERPTFRPANRARVNALLDEVARPIAERHESSLAQVAIAWVIAQDGVTSAIVGARDPDQVAENAGAAELELSATELATLARAFSGLELDLSPAG